MSIRTAIAGIPGPVKLVIGTGLAVVLGLALWFGLITRAWNKIGSLLFHHQEAQLSQDVQKQLDQAAEQKKLLEATLRELADSKKAEAAAVARSKELEGIFNDKSKTAAEKVKAFNAAMSAAPIHTDPTGVTTNQLCERAKSIGSSPETIAALCGQ